MGSSIGDFIAGNVNFTDNTLEEEEKFILEEVKYKTDVCNCDHQWVISLSQILILLITH